MSLLSIAGCKHQPAEEFFFHVSIQRDVQQLSLTSTIGTSMINCQHFNQYRANNMTKAQSGIYHLSILHLKTQVTYTFVVPETSGSYSATTVQHK